MGTPPSFLFISLHPRDGGGGAFTAPAARSVKDAKERERERERGGYRGCLLSNVSERRSSCSQRIGI